MTQVKSTFGNFAFTIKAELTPEQEQSLAAAGLLQVAQRSPATAAEKKLAGYDKKRPEGFKRTDIAFSDAGAQTLKEFLSKLTVDVSSDPEKEQIEEILCDVEVSEYVPGEGATPKFTRERDLYVKRAAEGKIATVADKVGYTGDQGDGSAEGAPVEFLRAIKVWLDETAKSLLA